MSKVTNTTANNLMRQSPLSGVAMVKKQALKNAVIFSFLLLCGGAFSSVYAATILVPGGQPTIAAAIAAAVDGDIVEVATGTYAESINFGAKNITVTAPAGATLTGSGADGAVVTFNNAAITNAAVLSGFTIDNSAATNNARGIAISAGAAPTIQGCNIEGNTPPTWQVGGGVYLTGAGTGVNIQSSTLGGNAANKNNCGTGCGFYATGATGVIALNGVTISQNHATAVGGGFYVTGVTNATVTNSTIDSNISINAQGGGGAYVLNSVVTFNNTNITNNSGYAGTSGVGGGIRVDGATSNVTFNGGSISGNAAWNGVGVEISNSAQLTVDGTMIDSNSTVGTNGTGGGIRLASGTLSLSNAYVRGNDINQYGGGLSVATGTTATIINTVFSGNTADGQSYSLGGGIYNAGGVINATNVTIAGNHATANGGGISGVGTYTNSIIWGNTATSTPNINGAPTVTYSDVFGGFAGTGNINADPLFTNLVAASAGTPTAAGDLHISLVSSPVVNTGTATGAPATDIDGDGRPQGTGIEMGADEFIEAAPNETLLGTISATASSNTSIAVSMGYTGDNNANNTYSVDYKLSAAGSWTNWVTAAAHVSSPYTTSITGLTEGVSYDVRMTFNDDDTVTGTNPTVVSNIITPASKTTVGVAGAVSAGLTSIYVSMPYTDDSNGNNTYTVEYKLSSEPTTWSSWVNGATHVASPYSTTITGLTNAASYDVRVTYNDGDTVSGTNPQVIAGVIPNLSLFTVTKTADTNDGVCDADCSLREAVGAANVAADTNIIIFAVNGTFSVTGAAGEDLNATGDLDVVYPIIINGNGAANTIISSAGLDRVFSFQTTAVASELNDITVQNGLVTTSGGCIYSTAAISVTNSTVTGCSASSGGAIASWGATLTNVNVNTNQATVNDGGAIFNSIAPLVINGAANSFSNNHTANGTGDFGGTIYSSTDVTISNATFTGDGDVTADALNGGAIFMDTGAALVMDNVSFSDFLAGNAGGAIYSRGVTITGGATFQNNVAVNDGGGIFNDSAPISINGNTLFDNNDAGLGTGDWGGAIYSATAITLNDVSGTTTFQNSDAQTGGAIYLHTGASLTAVNPSFIGNTAINAGGAVLSRGLTITGGATFQNNSTSGAGGGIYNDTAPVSINGTTLFDNNDAGSATGDWGGAIYSRTSVTLNDVDGATTFQNNDALNGGAIYMFATTPVAALTMVNPTFIANTASSVGGAIVSRGLTITGGATFQNNSAIVDGGAIYNNTNPLSINGTVLFSNNSAGSAANQQGGAIYSATAVNLNDVIGASTFQSNSAYAGGAIYTEAGIPLTMVSPTFIGNTAVNAGGGVRVSGLTITGGATFQNNIAGNEGGGIYNDTLPFSMNGNLLFDNNDAGDGAPPVVPASGDAGGAIYTAVALVINDISGTATFQNNDAWSGGAIYTFNATSAFTATSPTFIANRAMGGVGGAILSRGLTVTDATFTNNTALANGGAIANYNLMSMSITGNSVFKGNQYTGTGGLGGGAIYSEGVATIDGATFGGPNPGDENISSEAGGAIFTDMTINISNSTFERNQSGTSGGAVRSNGATLTSNTFTSNSSSYTGNADGGGGAIISADSVTINGSNNVFSNNTALTGSAGAVFSYNTLTISNATFSNNQADYQGGAVLVRNGTLGTLIVDNSIFDSNTTNDIGGATSARQTSTITNSVFTNNISTGTRSGRAGAVWSNGSVSVDNSRFSGNQAQGSNLIANGDGGAIWSDINSTVTNSSFDNNTAGHFGGAIYLNGDTLTLTNSTLSTNSSVNNGGGVHAASITAKNSTFYNNDSTAGTNDAINAAGTLFNTVVYSPAGTACSAVTSSAINSVNLQFGGTCFTAQAQDLSVDPQLGLLSFNGGTTKTHAPSNGASPVINAANITTCTDVASVNNLDQQGRVRNTGDSLCDIGAHEGLTVNTAPIGGYTADNVIPAAQITQSGNADGVMTVNWRGKDGEQNNLFLSGFEYSISGGAWTANSTALSANWSNNGGVGYASAVDYSGAVHSFTFNTKHADVAANFVGQNNVRIRFALTDSLLSSAAPVTSESFVVDNLAPVLTISGSDYNVVNNTLTIIGSGFNTVAANGTDILSQLNWNNIVWDINGDGATTADITMLQTDVLSFTVVSDSSMGLIFSTAKSDAIEANADFRNTGGVDTLDIASGFFIDAAGNVSTSSVVNAPLNDLTAPAAVLDLATGTIGAGTVNSTSVQLTWSAPGNDGSLMTAASYDVRYSTAAITSDAAFNIAVQATGEPAPQAAGGSESFTVTGLSPSTLYYFAVKALDASANVAVLSNSPSVMTEAPDSIAPAQITNLAAPVVTGNSVQLTWTAVGDDVNAGIATTYNLRYSTTPITNDAEFNAATAITIPAPQIATTAESFTVTTLTVNQTYYFAIKAMDETPNSGVLSNVVTVVPDTTAPSTVADLNHNVGALTNSSIQLTWTAPGDDGATGTATSYDIRYSTSLISNDADFNAAIPAVAEPVPQVASTTETFTLFGLSTNTTYYVAIKTTDEWPNTSLLSNLLTVTTSNFDSTLPGAVSDLSTGITSNSSVQLSWTAVGDDALLGTATSYDVRYATTPIINDTDFNAATAAFGEPVPQLSGNTEFFTVNGLAASQSYYFAVKVSDEVPNVGPLSNVVNEITQTAGNLVLHPSGSHPIDSASYTGATSVTAMDSNDNVTYANLAGTGNDVYAYIDDTNQTGNINYVQVVMNGRSFDYATLSGFGIGLRTYDTTYTTAASVAAEAFANGLTYATNPFTGGAWTWQEVNDLVAVIDHTDSVGLWVDELRIEVNYSPDVTAPAAVGNLAIPNKTSTTAQLTWTAPGDDGNSDTASLYDIRYSTSLINDANWATATQVIGESIPQPAGSFESLVVSGLLPSTTYYFAIKSRDEVPNESLLSNVISVLTDATGGVVDVTAPSTISDLSVVAASTTTVQLRWTAPGDDDFTGTATTYDLRYATTPILLDSDYTSATSVVGELTPQIAGSTEVFTVSGLDASQTYYFAMKTRDEVPNISPVSNVVSGTTTGSANLILHPSGAYTLDSTSYYVNSTAAAAYDSDDGYGTYSVLQASGNDIYMHLDNTYLSGTINSVQVYSVSRSYNNSITTTFNLGVRTNDVNHLVAASTGVNGTNAGALYTVNPSTGLAWTWEEINNLVVVFDKTDEIQTYVTELRAEINFSADDTVAPTAVTDLAAPNNGASWAQLTWTAPGDDGDAGTASVYDIRYSTALIDAANWDAATPVIGEPAPQLSGSMESMVISGLSPSTPYYFAMKVRDEMPNITVLSNVVTVTTAATDSGLDTTAPAAVADLTVVSTTSSSVSLSWTAPGDDLNTGSATLYDIRYAIAPITEANWDSASQVIGEGTPLIAGSVEFLTVSSLDPGVTYYFAVRARDEVPNISDVSNNVDAITSGSGNLRLHPSGLFVGDTAPYTPDSVTVLGTADSSYSRLVGTAVDIFQYIEDPTQSGTIHSVQVKAVVRSENGGAEGFDLGVQIAGVNYLTALSTTSTAFGTRVGQLYSVNPDTLLAWTWDDLKGLVGVLDHTSSAQAMYVDELYLEIDYTPDTTPPAAVTDLVASGATATTMKLNWTAPGNDGTVGQAVIYDLRYSTSNILTAADWDNATQLVGEPTPQLAGSWEVYTVSGLTASTPYYFAMKSRDSAPNESAISNIVAASTTAIPAVADTTPPAAVSDLAVMTSSGDSVTLRWSAPGDDGLNGQASVYDVRYAFSAILTDADFDNATPVAGESVPSLSGETEYLLVSGLDSGMTYYFAMKSRDEVPNISNLSNTVSSNTIGAGLPSNVMILHPSGDAGSSNFNFSVSAASDLDVLNDGAMAVLGGQNVGGLKLEIDDTVLSGSITSVQVKMTGRGAGTPFLMGLAPNHFASGTVQYATTYSFDTSWASDIYTINPTTNVAWTLADINALVVDIAVLSSTSGIYVEELYVEVVHSGDSPTPPAAVADLAVSTFDVGSATLTWTAPGSDGNVGTAFDYDIRYSISNIVTDADWNNATQVSGEPAPQAAGSAETYKVDYLNAGTTYYFAIKSRDSGFVKSALSNVPSITTLGIASGLPMGGFNAYNVLPAAQITQAADGTGNINICWKGVDPDGNNVGLWDFWFSKDSGVTWHTPGEVTDPTTASSGNGDVSPAFSYSWIKNTNFAGYTSAIDLASAPVHCFTLNTKHADIGLDGLDLSTVRVRFKLFDQLYEPWEVGQVRSGSSTDYLVSEDFRVDNQVASATFGTVSYVSLANRLEIAGSGFASIAAVGTDIRGSVDFANFVWDIASDDALTADVTFALSDVVSLVVSSDTQLTMTLTVAKGSALEATAGYGGIDDGLDVSAGFIRDNFGNPSPTTAANAAITINDLTPNVTAGKVSSIVSDPANGVTNPKRIPGAVVSYTIEVSNAGGAKPDADTIFIVDDIDTTQLSLKVSSISFTDGATSSGLTLGAISYSNSAVGGPYTFGYTPVLDGQGYDPAITAIRVQTLGSFSFGGAPAASFSIGYQVLVK